MYIVNLLIYGIVASLLWTEVQTVLLTSTLITGLMGGYLIGRMPLTTFIGALTNNATLPTLPTLPPVSSFLPSFPTFTPRQEEPKNVETANIVTIATTTTTPTPYVPPAYTYPPYLPYNYVYPTPAPTQPPTPNFNYAFPNMLMGNNGIYPYNNFFTSTTTKAPPSSTLDLDPNYFSPVEVPVSLDNKIRERFIRQLALIDPLNCLPKTFCEVTSDPYRAALALDKGSVLGMASMTQPRITREELIAYESRLPTPRPPPKPSATPTTTSTTTTSTPERDEAEDEEEEDDDEDKSHSSSDEAPEPDEHPRHPQHPHHPRHPQHPHNHRHPQHPHHGIGHPEDDTDSGSHSEETSNEEEEDDSFERYRKEHEHKLEMQALDEMIDEIEDPETYMYILRDKQKRKEARKKYRQKNNKNAEFLGRGGLNSFRHDPLVSEAMMGSRYSNDYEEPPMLLSRRASSDVDYEYPPPPPVLPPPLPQPPSRMPQPSFFRRATTEAPIKDMFADDPFFDDVKGRSARQIKEKASGRSRRTKRDLVGDPLTQYRLAYIVAEKYKNPNLCNVAFPSCPYQTKTIMSVVNRLESGLLPFGKSQVNRYKDKENRNNLEQFRNTLVAIERLNKATMDARARGEPIDIDEMTEVASNPSADIDSHASENIVNEFQRVVAKIQNAQFTKRRLQIEKAKPKNGDRPRTNYDAVHYHKKAQMDDLKPKERLKTGILQTKTNVRQQDDEAPHAKTVPTFKETYREMFKKNVKKKAGRGPSNSRKGVNGAMATTKEGGKNKIETKATTERPKIDSMKATKSKQRGNNNDGDRKVAKNRATTNNAPRRRTKNKQDNKKPPETWEDDERDARNEELAVDAIITNGRTNRSPIF